MMAAIQAVVIVAGQDIVKQRAGLDAIGPYRSRGHGEGLFFNKHSQHKVAHDKRAAAKRRNVLRNRRAHA